MENNQSHINSEQFRAVLGNYPTGVAVVTGLDATGEPLGMVVGTFTSVSLEPPLVAFLPMKTSRTFNVLREASDRFCINILAADQEGICRTLAAPGDRKFDTVKWHRSPLNNPVIDGVVGWIDCTYANVVDGGDHFIVLGAVQHMGLERDALPLLFFQRGYGRFSTVPLMLNNEREVLHAVRLAEQAREDIEAIARELDVGCSVVAPSGTDSVYVAVADHACAQGSNNRLGVRAPLLPPLGALFIGASNAISEEVWLSRLGKCPPETQERAKEQLQRVRQRGWSISLRGASVQELDSALELYSCPHRTPEQERRFMATVSRMFDMHEPEHISPAHNYEVLHLNVPIRNASGETLLALRLSELPSAMPGAQVLSYVEKLQGIAARIEAKIACLSA
ncbi:flavin reductase [Comamonas sp. NoAH]|uniref:flavin reductase n=1 Tax=Comamonas halotolerans TaxID=3041496 RepID=UPI0024E194B7|nr:flavin reductase [Comamonas sp. NoAH]